MSLLSRADAVRAAIAVPVRALPGAAAPSVAEVPSLRKLLGALRADPLARRVGDVCGAPVECDGPAAAALGEFAVSANAIGIDATADPTPSISARAPTRPMSREWVNTAGSVRREFAGIMASPLCGG
jgi:hypothetical protein